ncbi:hypothetical protein NIES4071_61600 [Calothrix sp. NIES-4071]|nr:hypothetical protein NIES4071_61600 [Calothrix sp. NIES-4071]BAZ60464.1 hypothetical protein NIES4105_61550 [Calothrix sp. NIES-4105]
MTGKNIKVNSEPSLTRNKTFVQSLLIIKSISSKNGVYLFMSRALKTIAVSKV